LGREAAKGGRGGKGLGRRTEHEDIQDQDNEAQHASTGAVFPGVAVAARCERLLGHGEGDEEQVKYE